MVLWGGWEGAQQRRLGGGPAPPRSLAPVDSLPHPLPADWLGWAQVLMSNVVALVWNTYMSYKSHLA